MPLYVLKILPSFKSQLVRFIKKYPKEETNLENFLKKLLPNKGRRMQGFGDLEVYKIRVPLKRYNISKSDGLRIVFVVFNAYIIPFAIYQHSEFHNHKDEKEYITEKYKKLLHEL